MRLRLSRKLSANTARQIRAALDRLPELIPYPIRIECSPALTAHRGRLLSGQIGRGTPVHAASFIRERRIVLETDLVSDSDGLRLILIHELFHFVWSRLGNASRLEFKTILLEELARGARGELGESAAAKKAELAAGREASLADYLCESFCDTAAWYFSGVRKHPEFSLALRWRNRRAQWFAAAFGPPPSRALK